MPNTQKKDPLTKLNAKIEKEVADCLKPITDRMAELQKELKAQEKWEKNANFIARGWNDMFGRDADDISDDLKTEKRVYDASVPICTVQAGGNLLGGKSR